MTQPHVIINSKIAENNVATYVATHMIIPLLFEIATPQII